MIFETTMEDIPELVFKGKDFGKRLMEESRLSYNSKDIARVFRMLVEHPDGLLLHWREEGEIIGVIGGIFDSLFFASQSTLLVIRMLEVIPKGVGKGIARKLLEAAIRYGKQREVRFITIGHGTFNSEKDIPKILKYYKRKNFKFLDMTFIKEI